MTANPSGNSIEFDSPQPMPRRVRTILTCALVVGGALEVFSHVEGPPALVSQFASLAGLLMMSVAVLMFATRAGAGVFVFTAMFIAATCVVGTQTARFLAHVPVSDGRMLVDNESYTYEIFVSVLDPIPPVAIVLGFFFLVFRISDKHESLLRRTAQMRAVRAENDALQKRMQQSEKLESLGVLTGGVAHDFNNYLMGILGSAESVLDDVPADPNVREALQRIHEIAEKAAGLTRQLLTFGGKGPAEKEPIAVNELIETLTGYFHASIPKTIELEWNLADTPLVIEANRWQLHQVIVNLVTNAAEAIDGPGCISITTNAVQMTHADLRTYYLAEQCEPGEYVSIEVADSGSGIEPDILHRIFDPFFTTKPDGRGLGLAVVVGSVRSNGGAISIDTPPEGGARFRVLFPRSQKPPRRLEAKAPHRTQRAGGGTILVVDDEPFVRKAAAAMCERLGYRVVTAGNGEEALAKLEDIDSDGVMALIDIIMPRMDGIELMQAIQSRKNRVPMVLMTGYSGETRIDELTVKNGVNVLQKPFSIAELEEALGSLDRTAAVK